MKKDPWHAPGPELAPQNGGLSAGCEPDLRPPILTFTAHDRAKSFIMGAVKKNMQESK